MRQPRLHRNSFSRSAQLPFPLPVDPGVLKEGDALGGVDEVGLGGGAGLGGVGPAGFFLYLVDDLTP